MAIASAVRQARTWSDATSSTGSYVAEHRRRGEGLGAAGVVEVGVETTLHPALGVPGGPTVPDQDQPVQAHSPAAVWSRGGPYTSSGNVSVGQSFHSLSRP